MTPNKLPPLPEPRIVSYQTDSTMRTTELRTYSESDMHAYAAEAIRQSQSLPAGAVAGWLDGDSYMSPKTKARLIEAGKAPGASIGEVTFGKIAEKHDIPLYTALQADAREKGEAVVPEGFALVPVELTAENGAKSALIGEVEVRDHSSQWVPVTWTAIKELHRKMIAHFAATQPAQASEKDITDAMVDAVGSKLYVYWNEVNDTCREKYREKVRGALASAMATDFPECSGTPSDCPENEGYGCCKAQPAQASEAAVWRRKNLHGTGWIYHNTKPERHAEPLYATPVAAQPAEVTDAMVDRAVSAAAKEGGKGTHNSRRIIRAALIAALASSQHGESK